MSVFWIQSDILTGFKVRLDHRWADKKDIFLAFIWLCHRKLKSLTTKFIGRQLVWENFEPVRRSNFIVWRLYYVVNLFATCRSEPIFTTTSPSNFINLMFLARLVYQPKNLIQSCFSRRHWHWRHCLCTPSPATGLDIETSYLVYICPPCMHIK